MKNVLLYELSKVRLSILHPTNKLCESKEIELLLELEIAEDSLLKLCNHFRFHGILSVHNTDKSGNVWSTTANPQVIYYSISSKN